MSTWGLDLGSLALPCLVHSESHNNTWVGVGNTMLNCLPALLSSLGSGLHFPNPKSQFSTMHTLVLLVVHSCTIPSSGPVQTIGTSHLLSNQAHVNAYVNWNRYNTQTPFQFQHEPTRRYIYSSTNAPRLHGLALHTIRQVISFIVPPVSPCRLETTTLELNLTT